MPAKYFFVSSRADKSFLKFPKNIQKRILDTYDLLQANPIIGMKLHGELAGYFKFRVGDYRIIYKFDAKESAVGVVKIEHRQGVYR